MDKLTRRQASIIGAFTGTCCGPFRDLHGYVDSLPGFKGIPNVAFANKAVMERIAEAAKADFIALCPTLDDQPP
jgi:hypothetical protein